MTFDVGANAKRLITVVLAAALAIVLAVVLGSGVVGPSRSASAQGSNPLAISTTVYPSPASSILTGTRMDFLITEYNTARSRARNVVVNDQLPAGVTYVSAKPSQGRCNPMADEPVITCELGTIPGRGVAHINIVVTATTRGTHSNVVSDNRGNQASARFTIVPRLYQ